MYKYFIIFIYKEWQSYINIYIIYTHTYIISERGKYALTFKNLFILALAFSVGSIIIPAVATMTARQRIKAVCGKAAAVEFIAREIQYTCKCCSQ